MFIARPLFEIAEVIKNTIKPDQKYTHSKIKKELFLYWFCYSLVISTLWYVDIETYLLIMHKVGLSWHAYFSERNFIMNLIFSSNSLIYQHYENNHRSKSF